MKPYYQDDHVTLYHGDCREVLPGMAADLVVTSPPYNKGPQSGAYANMADGYRSYGDDLGEAEYVDWQQSVLSLLWNVTAPGGAIFYNHKPQLQGGAVLLPTRLVPEHMTLRQVIVWDRGGGMNWNASFFVPRHEWVLLIAHPDFRLADRGASNAGDVWRIGIEQTDFGHPCPYPQTLPATAIAATTASVIADPFAGSGTTLRAAKDLGRKAIGVELDERYCEIAAKRCAQEVLDFGGAV